MSLSADPRATLVPGGRPLPARKLYFALKAALGFLTAVAFATYGLYVVREANLTALVVFEALLIAAMVVFGTATFFVLALGAYWLTAWVRAASEPLTLAWLNRGLDPRSRATVLSLHGQADALGQGAGGPGMGILATVTNVRVALVAAGLLLVPALPIFARQLSSEESPNPEGTSQRQD